MNDIHEANHEENECCIDSAIDVINNIVETACELEHELDLMHLVNFIDLYHTYLQFAAKPEYHLRKHSASLRKPADAIFTDKTNDIRIVSFDRFVKDVRLISFAAQVASVKSGHTVSTPPPLASCSSCGVV